ncbi:hypothetical protein [Nitrosomonas eutropha]|uniref:Uncharacterized protein n=1 Tax=Nitrosomonas eutropha TaxID=916 RepID=A0ABX5M983_9PROT|nr:hypothetical protein [Nitrosomonas eutropha]PXV82460.1 hypothetical protein C8R14_10732 [Nitrosomonas eutropha]
MAGEDEGGRVTTRTLTQYAEVVTIITLLAGIAYLIFAVAAAPDLSKKLDADGGNICILDDELDYVAFGMDYSELFPAGHEYGKDGEIIMTDDLLPDPANPYGINGYPALRWAEQSMTGQSPPVLYWPAPAYKQVLKKPGKPCADKYKHVAEPGILAIIGAALLAAAIVK